MILSNNHQVIVLYSCHFVCFSGMEFLMWVELRQYLNYLRFHTQ